MARRTTTLACLTLALAAAGCCLAACSHPPARHAAPVVDVPALPLPSPTLPPPPPPPPLSSTESTQEFAESTAVSCAGQPSADQVLSKVRGSGVVTGGARVTVQLGPVCAGTWQYTIFQVAGAGPLGVVTEGQPASLTVVTAGTDVCSSTVVGQAPPGIVDVTQCGGLGALPGGSGASPGGLDTAPGGLGGAPGGEPGALDTAPGGLGALPG